MFNYYCHQDKLERNVLFAHTQSTYHNWIRSDYYTLSQLLSMYKTTANCQFDLRKSHSMSNNDSHNSLYRHKLSGQSYTPPILRRTGNSPIWDKITVPTRRSSMYDSPTHTADYPAKITNQVHRSELVNYPNLRTVPTSAAKRAIDRVVDRYIVLQISRKIY